MPSLHALPSILLGVPAVYVSIVDRKGSTALMKAISYQHARAVKALLKAPGIHDNVVDFEGHSALSHALMLEEREIVDLLLAYPGIAVPSSLDLS
jgi:ankyrin repeat protein